MGLHIRARLGLRLVPSRKSKEVEVKMMKGTTALVAMILGLGGAISAHAAGGFTLTCDAARSGAITIQLTGFNVVVSGSGDSTMGAASGKGLERNEAKFALTVTIDSGKDYQTLLSMFEDGEVLRSCKLIDGEGGGVTASDSWTEANAKGKNKSKTNPPAGSAGGALEWILTNATVTGVTATGSQSSTGVPTTSLQATIEAQKFTFTM